MAKKSAPLQEVERLLDLVPYLSVNPYISLKELAAEFKVSERDMSNELIALSMCGLPRYTPYELIDVSIESGYVSISNHETLDIPRALSSGELSSFLLGLNLIKDAFLSSSESSESLLSKVAQVDSLINRLKNLLDTPIDIELTTSSHFLGEIERAIASRGSLSICYLSSAEDVSKERVIQPLALSREGQQIYISAYCLSSQAHRNFRLDRIEALSPTIVSADSAEMEKSSSVKVEISDVDSISPQKVKLKIKRNKRRYAELLNIESVPASGLVEIEVYSEAWLVRAVSASRGEIEIVAGREIAAQIVARATKILALYRS